LLRPFTQRTQDIQKAIADSGAAEIIAKLPEGLETEMSATFSNLSVGQRQRLVIARAFLRNAPLLLLDEPTSALDVRSEELVTEAIGRLRAGRTCVMITHRISTARDADVVVGGGGKRAQCSRAAACVCVSRFAQ
jgi:ABC-type multidrug transport system fused ATPase/permease subunit